MNTTTRHGLLVATITIAIVGGLASMYWGVRYLTRPASPTETVVEPAVLGVEDQDGDGLPDEFEAIYRTAPDNPDTDNDGIDDLAELEAGRDPTIPGPDDVIAPPTGDDVADLVANSDTLTARYLASLPENISRGDVLDESRLTAFVEQHQGSALPEVVDSEIKTTEDEGADAIAAYLGAITASHNDDLHAITDDDIEQALTTFLQTDDTAMNTLITQLDSNIVTLKTVPAPAEVRDLHRTLLGATMALRDSVAALRDIDDDFVAGLVASRNIDSLGATFQDIASQVQQLEEKYELE